MDQAVTADGHVYRNQVVTPDGHDSANLAVTLYSHEVVMQRFGPRFVPSVRLGQYLVPAGIDFSSFHQLPQIGKTWAIGLRSKVGVIVRFLVPPHVGVFYCDISKSQDFRGWLRIAHYFQGWPGGKRSHGRASGRERNRRRQRFRRARLRLRIKTAQQFWAFSIAHPPWTREYRYLAGLGPFTDEERDKYGLDPETQEDRDFWRIRTEEERAVRERGFAAERQRRHRARFREQQAQMDANKRSETMRELVELGVIPPEFR
jgi:hypothetical protein